ncbi:MAG TPA: DUF883 C-terminal domain-containing protein [Blastocatellia bacterium]|nr:DUF883 C-terminal domain-containing protein [Blastocatellia bacterium]
MEPDIDIAKPAREREEMAGRSTFDSIKTTVADKLETAASAIRQKAREAEKPDSGLMGYGNQASEWLDSSASYIREMDPQKVKADIQEQVRRNPGRSLLIAGAAGLILGALLRRR